jgi:drug/metabolite transporter (DMT)-like permease
MVGVFVVGTKDFMGAGRYLISAFPLFLTGALLLRERPRVRHAILAVGGVALVVLSWAFGRELYVS